MIQVLFIEDDKNIAEMLKIILEENHYIVDYFSCLNDVQLQPNYDLAIIDLTLPDGFGLDFANELKRTHSNTKIIFLTASVDEENTLLGLNIGDDYITKPFKTTILLARIKNILNREIKIHSHKDIILDSVNFKVLKNNKEIKLTSLEFKLLETLLKNKNQVLTREQILELIWDNNGNYVNNNTLSVYIKRIRKKLEDENETFIITIRNIGYKIGE